jgi:hypothetical protein
VYRRFQCEETDHLKLRANIKLSPAIGEISDKHCKCFSVKVKVKVKVSRYVPWRCMGGEEV